MTTSPFNGILFIFIDEIVNERNQTVSNREYLRVRIHTGRTRIGNRLGFTVSLQMYRPGRIPTAIFCRLARAKNHGFDMRPRR